MGVGDDATGASEGVTGAGGVARREEAGAVAAAAMEADRTTQATNASAGDGPVDPGIAEAAATLVGVKYAGRPSAGRLVAHPYIGSPGFGLPGPVPHGGNEAPPAFPKAIWARWVAGGGSQMLADRARARLDYLAEVLPAYARALRETSIEMMIPPEIRARPERASEMVQMVSYRPGNKVTRRLLFNPFHFTQLTEAGGEPAGGGDVGHLIDYVTAHEVAHVLQLDALIAAAQNAGLAPRDVLVYAGAALHQVANGHGPEFQWALALIRAVAAGPVPDHGVNCSAGPFPAALGEMFRYNCRAKQ
jgi:hypothetical protein